ncbi:AI-2E family transporter [Candidatus Magnetobacterium casense]|uniref:AI-2E family transporter n=1 Tax=Candidatus Magnetobacterium casense TaxID=1455061 RepID=A0ABS6RZW2_9BACT|nr:AI-2E family transporter [Candidatus Magnetobacterium casensis]MBV6342086.1 AI-2E family transporter [Candidatus Magnetobacterium casensis]
MHKLTDKPVISTYDFVAWGIATVSLVLIVRLHLLSALLSGLLVFELIHTLSKKIRVRGISGHGSKIIIVTLLASIIVLVVCLMTVGTVSFFRGSIGNLPVLLQKMADIIEDSLNSFPVWIVHLLPSDTAELKGAIATWLRDHASYLQLAGQEALRTTAHILIGMVMGALIALDEAIETRHYGPLGQAMLGNVVRLGQSFHRIVFAQVRISAINTVFAALYLTVVLPLFGVHLNLIKTLIAVTFFAGLLPVAGNLISNTVIIIVSLNHSFNVAVSSLVFLVVIHKLEYFLNAKIIGTQIKSKAWEMLLAMIIMESAFGISGVVAAPIYYAYFKDELISKRLL